MAFSTETDPQARIDELRRERDDIDTQIAQLHEVEVEMLSPQRKDELRDLLGQVSQLDAKINRNLL